MTLPPLSLWIRVEAPERRPIRLWLPLFLLWFSLLPLLLLAFVLTLIVDVFLWLAGRPYHYYTFLLYGSLGLLAATRGTVVHIDGDGTTVDLTIN